MKTTKILLVFPIMLLLSGCASTITAKPGGDSGIPYYLPKPYLLITKNLCPIRTETTGRETGTGEDEKKIIKTKPVSSCDKGQDSFSFQVIYLPDLAQKHGLKIASRTGVINTTVTLVDGWKFTGLNLYADAKTYETIQAVGSAVVQAASPFKAAPETTAKALPPGTDVQARAEEPRAGLWLYAISVDDDGNTPYDLVIKWTPLK